jgi:hypothetical protein
MNKFPSSNNESVNPEKKINKQTNQGIITQRARIKNWAVKGGDESINPEKKTTDRQTKESSCKGQELETGL